MTPAALFGVMNAVVLPAWLMLIFLPRFKWTRIVAAYAVPGGLAIVYLALLVMNPWPAGSGFATIAQVERLFSSSWLLLAGWIHYLAFDLFVGAWEVRDATRLHIPHLLVVPCLILTFLIGPVGLALYFIVRIAMVRKLPGHP
ncbi:MAG TPA: ABA4-like family protein [Vicinamibacterales bacterium]